MQDNPIDFGDSRFNCSLAGTHFCNRLREVAATRSERPRIESRPRLHHDHVSPSIQKAFPAQIQQNHGQFYKRLGNWEIRGFINSLEIGLEQPAKANRVLQ